MTIEKDIRNRYDNAGQSHVFDYFDKLTESEKETFLKQLDAIEIEKLGELLNGALAGEQSYTQDIQPFNDQVGRFNDKDLIVKSRLTGMTALKAGQVAALVLAGGQGTRLGFDGPKGIYNIGLPSNRSLFQLIVERIKKLEVLAGAKIPFYIMTSPLNHSTTISYFESNNYFGMSSNDVIFFQQGMLPCISESGKVIMESPGSVSMAPDGNGGIYPSLQRSGTLDDMKERGIKYLHVFSIDNALVRPADPVFIGYCIDQRADCGNKVVWKSHAHEKVGVVAKRSGKPCIVEYSEITKEMAERVDEAGRLQFGAGNICNHFYTIDFICDKILPNMGDLYHIARKKIPYYDSESESTVTPDENNGIKLETFIFDVFPLSDKMAIYDADRSEEFSPVKNMAGSPSDSPDTAREMISALAKKWLLDAGAELVGDLDGICEISPMTSYAGEGLERYAGVRVECPFSI